MKIKIDQVETEESGEIKNYGFKFVLRFKLRKDIAIRLMDEHKFPLVDVNGDKFDIKVSKKGEKYLRTFNDNYKKDNLQNLPVCKGYDLTKLAEFVLKILAKF
jgi:hypothetical protein